MILALGTMLCRADAVSTPYNIGMLRSTMTRSGARPRFCDGSLPVASPWQQALKGVALSMKLQNLTAARQRCHLQRGFTVSGETAWQKKLLPFII